MPDNYITLPQLTKTTKGLVNKINTESTVINSKIGNLANLNTTVKTDLVAAINEAASSGTQYDDTALAGRVTALENAGYITSYTETDPTVPAWAKEATKPTYTASEVGALPDTTTIPTKTSDLTNDSGFITSYTETDPVFTASAAAGISSTDISNWNAKSDFSGSYNDLTDQPTIPEDKIFPINVTLTSLTQGTSNKTHTEIFNAVTNGKIPIVNTSFDNTKMIAFLTHSSSEYAIFTYINQLDNAVTIKYAEMRIFNNIVTLTNLIDKFITSTDIPTKTSDLNNDSGFITNSDISNFITNETDPVFTASAASGITSTDIFNWNAKSDFSGSYNDLTDQPTIPDVPAWALTANKPTYTASEVGALPDTTVIPAATTVTNTLASGTLIATINGTNIYAPAYTDADGVSY